MTRKRLLLLSGTAAVVAVLFLAYLSQAGTVVVGSDGATNELQAWDMLHGNLLLHGWSMQDVGFYTTELPEYALLEALRGLTPEVVRIGGALTYTILIVAAAVVAAGRASRSEQVTRGLIAAGIMLAPAPGFGTSLVLHTPDHIGSAVPVLLTWLVIDRFPHRWYVPLITWGLLTWGILADPLVAVLAAPLVLIFAERAISSRPRSRLYAAQAAVPVAAYGAAAGISALIRADGGFTLHPVSTGFAGLAHLGHSAFLTMQGLGVLFGASFVRGQPVNMILSALHLAGLALAAAALVIALRRFRSAEPVVPGLALAILFDVALYLPGRYVHDLLGTREISPVLPLAAALAGRVLAAKIKPVLVPLGCVLAGYAASLALYSAAPDVPAQQENLAAWLSAHHLHRGLATSYWLANIVTVDTGGATTVRQVTVTDGRLAEPSGWGFSTGWYDPSLAGADFVVTGQGGGGAAAATRTFGPPAATYQYAGCTILTWPAGRNLLAAMLLPGRSGT